MSDEMVINGRNSLAAGDLILASVEEAVGRIKNADDRISELNDGIERSERAREKLHLWRLAHVKLLAELGYDDQGNQYPQEASATTL